jgi:PqqD family protein of HPr-rel-A system
MIMLIKGNIAISDNGFVFNPSTGDSFTLNNSGMEVLMLIKEGKSINQIADLLSEKYEVDKNKLERYLADFLNDLSLNNLLEDQEWNGEK